MTIRCTSGDEDFLEIDGDGGELAVVLFGSGVVNVSKADEARLLKLLLDRAGGLQNMARPTCNCPRCAPLCFPRWRPVP